MFPIDFLQSVRLLDLRVLVLVDFGKLTYNRATLELNGNRSHGIRSMPTTISNLG